MSARFLYISTVTIIIVRVLLVLLNKPYKKERVFKRISNKKSFLDDTAPTDVE